MKRLITATAAALLMLSSFSLYASPLAESDLRAAVKNYRQALVKKDIAALDKIWTDDYTFIDAHGRLRTKADRLADLKSAVTSLDAIRHEEEPKVRIHGDIGIVTTDVTLTGRYNGKAVEGEFRSTHIWTHRDGRWQLLMNQLTAIQ
jgi:ketosteroid isomerase-like protein